MCVLFSHVRVFATWQNVAHQAPQSMEFSRKKTVMGCHFLLQEIFLHVEFTIAPPGKLK